MLCSSAGRFYLQLVNFSAPCDKRELFDKALLIVYHDIEHLLVFQ